MPSCIVCHLQINESSDSFFTCSNGHPIHNNCLAEWLLNSQNCPLCSEPYLQNLIDQFKDFMEQKEKEKLDALEEEKRKEDMKKVEKLANKIVLLKLTESVENLIEEKKYDEALEKLMDLYDESNIGEKNIKILFLLGKTNYLKGRYDLAINFLFKLVKIKYDYPDGFLYLGKAYEKLGLLNKAKWAYDRVKE